MEYIWVCTYPQLWFRCWVGSQLDANQLDATSQEHIHNIVDADAPRDKTKLNFTGACHMLLLYQSVGQHLHTSEGQHSIDPLQV